MEISSPPAPFLRWAGSKRWLVPQLATRAPAEFERYFEPFLGSGAAYFAIGAGRPAELSDVIAPLINCFEQVAADPDLVGKIASEWATDAETYYEIRGETHDVDQVRAAARFLYLNRLCFNALYRENKAGQFNVPYGRPRATNTVADLPVLRRAAAVLGSPGTSLCVRDFEEALDRCAEGDFAFVDPPYALARRRENFAEYNSGLFSWEDQRRLAAAASRASKRGCRLVITNADHKSVVDLYPSMQIERVTRHSNMSGGTAGRGKLGELIITAGPGPIASD